MQSAKKYLGRIIPIVLTAFLLAASSTIAFGQTSGTLQGVVLDGTTNTPLIGAVVIATNQNNQISRNGVTNAQGRYTIAFLEPGKYTVSAQLDGYDPNSSPDIIIPLNVVTPLEVPPITLLPVGATPPTPTGTGTAAPAATITQTLLNLTDGSNRANFSSELLQALPLPGIRSFDFFAQLAPGVFPSPATTGSAGPGLGPGVGTSGQFSVNGRRARSNNFTIDGSDNNDQDIGVRRQGFVALVPQSIESLNEFQIATQGWDAELGRATGSQANAVSKSGGNEVHGTVYGFFTDSKLNARDFFDLKTGGTADKEPFTRAQEGFVIGGPIAKGKTYFFGSFERQDINALQEKNFAVPDALDRLFNRGEGGNISAPVGVSLLAIFPFPNNPAGPFGGNTFTRALPATSNGTVFSGKVTHKIGNSQLTGRYNFTDDDSILPSVGGALNASIGTDIRTQNVSIFFDSTVSNTSFNQIRVSYGRTTLAFPQQPGSPLLFGETAQTINLPRLAAELASSGSSFGASIFNDAFLKPLSTSFGNFGPFGRTGPLGQLIVSPFSPIGIDPFTFPQGRTNNTFQFADTFIQSIGSHSLKFGFDVKRNQLNSFLDRNFRPQVTFNGGLRAIGNQFSLIQGSDSALTGIPSQFFQTVALTPDSTIGLRFSEYNFFLTDNWKVNSRLTLDYGLRYEYSTVPEDANRRIEDTFDQMFPPSDPNIQNSQLGSIAQGFFEGVLKDASSALSVFLDNRRRIYRGDATNFGPRIGFAFTPTKDKNTVVRASYGVFYDQIIGSVTSQSRNVFPTFLPIVLDPNISFDAAGRNLPSLPSFFDSSLSDVFPLAPFIRQGTLNTAGIPPGLLRYETGILLYFTGARFDDPFGAKVAPAAGGLAFILPDANLRSPYSQQWNLSVEHQFAGNYALSAAYVGSTGTKLIRFRTPNGGPNAFTIVNFNPSLPNGFGPTSFAPPRKNPNLGPFTVIESSASSNFHSLQLSLRKRFSQGLQFGSSYTYGHAIDDVSDVFDTAGAFELPQDDNNLAAERASASFDVKHRSVTHFVYDVPFFKSNKLLDGFQLAGVLTLQTGQPFTVNVALDGNGDGNLTDRLLRDDLIKQVDKGPVRLSVPNLSLRDLIIAFAGSIDPSSLGRNGAVGRNTFRSAGVATLDLAVVKKFNITEKQNLILRTEFFNLFNRPHFATPEKILGAPAFGQSVSSSVPARIIQFAIKYSF